MHHQVWSIIIVLAAAGSAAGQGGFPKLPDMPQLPVPLPNPIKEPVKAPSPRAAGAAEIKEFIHRAYAEQENEVWCWLACAEMVHHYRGRTSEEYTQQGLARKIQGIENPNDSQVRAGGFLEILWALAPNSKIRTEKVTKFVGELLAGKPPSGIPPQRWPNLAAATTAFLQFADTGESLVIDEISRKRPVVALLKAGPGERSGHAVVLYGVTWDDKGQIAHVLVADPARNEQKRIKELTGAQLKARAQRFLSEDRAKALLKAIDEVLN